MTKRQTIFKLKYGACQGCGKLLTSHGRGAPRSLCSNQCRNRVLRRRYKPSARKPRKYLSNEDAHTLVNGIKLEIKTCAFHEFYHNGQSYLCTPDNLQAFCFDHIDRTKKHKSISQMIGISTKAQLLTEISKCMLVCANCHHIKTYENNDYKQIIKIIDPLMVEIYNQLSLFDN